VCDVQAPVSSVKTSAMDKLKKMSKESDLKKSALKDRDNKNEAVIANGNKRQNGKPGPKSDQIVAEKVSDNKTTAAAATPSVSTTAAAAAAVSALKSQNVGPAIPVVTQSQHSRSPDERTSEVLDTSADVSFRKRLRARETQETVRGAVANNNCYIFIASYLFFH
jgi:hypothetical protein